MLDKKLLMTMIAVTSLVLVSGIGSVNAYMHDRSTVNNHMTFMGDNGINAILTEPSWEKEKGILVIPNTIIPKDPQIQNISDIDMDIMTAVKVEFLYSQNHPDVKKRNQRISEEDMKYVLSVYDIDWNSEDAGDWIRFDNNSKYDSVQYFYYNKVLRRNYPLAGDRTEPLFTRLYIPKEVTNEQYRFVQELGEFHILISAKVIQQIDREEEMGLSSPYTAYKAGLFEFKE